MRVPRILALDSSLDNPGRKKIDATRFDCALHRPMPG